MGMLFMEWGRQPTGLGLLLEGRRWVGKSCGGGWITNEVGYQGDGMRETMVAHIAVLWQVYQIDMSLLKFSELMGSSNPCADCSGRIFRRVATAFAFATAPGKVEVMRGGGFVVRLSPTATAGEQWKKEWTTGMEGAMEKGVEGTFGTGRGSVIT